MDENKLLQEVSNNLGVEISDEIKTGKLHSINLLEDDETWLLNFSFPRVLPSDVINNYFISLKKNILEKISGKEVRFKVSYDDLTIDSSIISDYYKAGIKLWSQKRREILVLNTFREQYIGNQIKITVSTVEEKNVVRQALCFIDKYFILMGITNVETNVVIDDEAPNLMEKKQFELELAEQTNQAIRDEEYLKKKVVASQSQTVTQYKGYRNKNNIQVKIEDIPLDSLAVAEFGQINGTKKVYTEGVLVSKETRVIPNKKGGKDYLLFTGIVTDYKDSIIIKRFYQEADKDLFEKQLKPNVLVGINGSIQWDDFAKSVVIMCDRLDIRGEDKTRIRFDGSKIKRVELHAHTKMSILDSILNVDEYVNQAKNYGHSALAVTDHENCHVMPEFFKLAKKAGIKPIAGVECNYINDEKLKIALTDEDISLDEATYVVFDIEATGFCVDFNEIIEIGAVKFRKGLVIDNFSYFVKPDKPITDFITNLTAITNEQVYDALKIDDVLPKFKEFIKDSILVAHNAAYDTDFIYGNMKRLGIYEKPYPCIDTIQIARTLYAKNGLKRFNLGACAKFLKVDLEQQHRAIHDAKSTLNIFQKMLRDIKEMNISNYNQLNSLIEGSDLYKHVFPTHLNILVKNKVGLKNYYKIISDSHTNHYFRYARLMKSVLDQYREGILVGSGCVNGEVFRTALEKTTDKLEEVMKYYDYIEVQPPACYNFLFEKTNDPGSEEYIKSVIKKIISTAKKLNKLVVATGDVHELVKEDSPYRKIYLAVARPNGGGPHELSGYKSVVDMHFRNTQEMLDEFSFLPGDLAYEIVVTNTNKINDLIENFDLFPKELFVPRDDFRKDYGVPSMKAAINELCYETASSMYGENIPQYVKDRLEKELSAIIGHGYFSVYYISHLLVKNSNENGYVVGSRGSVGSSFVATMMKITEVNSLVPHYLCPKCHYSAFKFSEEEKKKYPQPHVSKEMDDILQSVGCGFDLPPMKCPVCGEELTRDGINIAFETFLGFTGEKCPDIDLNFSGDYQAKAHLFCQEVFGVNNAFRAGTISTVMDKTAFAYVRDYYQNNQITKRQCEIERLALFIAGAKKTTGQHPGGIVVVPDTIDIYDVTPIQFPPVSEKDDLSQITWRTSHYDYHSFEANLLKLDILGHDDPTLIRKLIEYVQKFPERFPFSTVEGIPVIDEGVLSLFKSKDALHINGDDLDTLSSGTIGMPEFGTKFVRGMLETIKPNTYNDIIKVSGLSHGTDVWAGNADALVSGTLPNFPKVEFKDVIGCRDDIMIFLIAHGMEAAVAFKIMEDVRKGRGLRDDQIKAMKDCNIPEWYIWTCKKIKYLFPKAHATAYVIMALRIGWFKVHRPIYYYAVYFSVRAKELDAEIFALGKNAIRNKIQEIESKLKNKKDTTNKEENLLDELKIALEMVLRGYTFKQIDLEKSLANDFVISDDEKSLYLPFTAIPSLGEAVANSIIEARQQHPFLSVKDVERRTSINKTQFAKMTALGIFDELPKDDENKLF